MTTAEIKRTRPDWELFRDGGPGGETPAQVYARGKECLELLTEQGGTVAAFSHGHFIRTLAVAWIDVDVIVAARLALDTASLSVLIESDRGRLLQRWNLRA